MKIVGGLKLGGLQQKIFNLMLIFIIALVGAFVAVRTYQQNSLSQIVEVAGSEQQASITEISQDTMEAVLEASLTKSTALQAYIAGDIFADVKSDVMTLQTLAEELFAHAENFSAHPFYPPIRTNDGIPSAQVQHESGVDPYQSESLGLVANMLSSCFVATADGNILFVDDRAGEYFDESGMVYDFEVRSRPWYVQAADAGELIFTGVELDAFTDIAGIVCAAPVYRDGELVAVVGADIFLTSISNYVESSTKDGGFICVVSENGQILFSPKKEGTFMPMLSSDAPISDRAQTRSLPDL